MHAGELSLLDAYRSLRQHGLQGGAYADTLLRSLSVHDGVGVGGGGGGDGGDSGGGDSGGGGGRGAPPMSLPSAEDAVVLADEEYMAKIVEVALMAL